MAFPIPPGFVFKPTDQKVITLYLKPKAMGLPLPCDRFLERNIYGKNGTPWIVFPNSDSWEIVGDSEVRVVKKEIYVFTELEKIGRRNIFRVAGCGTWTGKSKAKDIKNCKGEVIGVKKSFTFKVNGDLNQDEIDKKKGRWIMHEYTLAGSSLEGVNNKDCAICRISWDLPKCCVEEEEEAHLVVESDFRIVENIDESRKRKSSFEYPNKKKVCIEKDLNDKKLNSGAASDEDFLYWLDKMIFCDYNESTDFLFGHNVV